MSAPTIETRDGILQRATVPGLSAGLGDADVLVEAIENSNHEVVGVYISAECGVEVHNVPHLIHALKCAFEPYGGAR